MLDYIGWCFKRLMCGADIWQSITATVGQKTSVSEKTRKCLLGRVYSEAETSSTSTVMCKVVLVNLSVYAWFANLLASVSCL